MTNSPTLSNEPRQVDIQCATGWLRVHHLGEGPATPLLTARLAARRRARLLGSLLSAALILGAAAIEVTHWPEISALGAGGTKALLLTVFVAGLLLARALLDAWVRRVDRQTGLTLVRRVAHPAQPGLPALLGRP